MIRAICLLLALTGPAVASQHSWPALHDVIGVLGNDVLNVRSDPDRAGDVLTTLPSDTSDIEVIRPNDDLTWGLVNVNEGVLGVFDVPCAANETAATSVPGHNPVFRHRAFLVDYF